MPQTCILTDATALFLEKGFAGSEATYVLNSGKNVLGHPQYMHDWPANPGKELSISTQQFRQAFLSLANRFNEIFVVLTAAQLNRQQFDNALKAAEGLKGQVSIQIVDSQTLGPGLGQIVTAAAAFSAAGNSLSDIYRQTQNYIGHVYTIFCTRNLTLLADQGEFDLEHALIGEYLGIPPLLILENERIISTQKARNSRHLVELFIEFVDEFYALKHIFLFQSNPVFGSEISQLVERVVNTYPDVTLTQIVEHPVIQALLGEHSLGMVVIDR